MHIYVYTYIIHAYIHTYMHTHTHTHAYTHSYTHAYAHTHMHIQICTGDEWGPITRDLFAGFDAREMAGNEELYAGMGGNASLSPVPVVFFMSYMLIASIVLINIVIAVLLDEFLTTMSKSRNAFQQLEVESR